MLDVALHGPATHVLATHVLATHVLAAHALATRLLTHYALATYTLPDLRLVFLLLIGSGCWAALSRSRYAILPWLALVACSVAWLRVDQLREGRVLFRVSATHGLTEADLWVPAVVFTAAVTSGLQRMILLKRSQARHRQP